MDVLAKFAHLRFFSTSLSLILYHCLLYILLPPFGLDALDGLGGLDGLGFLVLGGCVVFGASG